MKFCPECGAKLTNENTKFCPECGAKLNATATPKAEEPPISSKPIDPLMEEYEYEVLPDGTYAIIKPKDKYKTKYVIPEGVSVIREHAFWDQNAMLAEEIFLPNSIRVIEHNACSQAKKLTKINFPEGLVGIGDEALSGTNIVTIVLPNTLKKLGSSVFCSCKNIVEIVLPNTINELPHRVFEHSRIGKITIPSNIFNIADGAFFGAHIEEIKFEEGLMTIGEYAFGNAFLPPIVTLPSSLLRVDDYNFDAAIGLEKIIYNGDLNIKVNLMVEIENKKNVEKRVHEERKTREEKKAKGIVAFAGVTVTDKCVVKRIGDMIFYIKETPYTSEIIGWESTREVNLLEIPNGCGSITPQCLKDISILVLPRDRERIVYHVRDQMIADFQKTGVKKIIIPKEVKEFIVSQNLMEGIAEIEFEDPTGWGVKKDIIIDPQKMCEYVLNGCLLKKSAVGSFFGKLFGGR